MSVPGIDFANNTPQVTALLSAPPITSRTATALGTQDSTSKHFGGFIGYNTQWDGAVISLEGTYNWIDKSLTATNSMSGGFALPGGAVYLHPQSFRSRSQRSVAAAVGPLTNVAFAVVLILFANAHLPDAHAALRRPPQPGTPLGLYLHIPFCRKRCKFCYFRVYTDKNARDVEVYLDALVKEVALYARQPVVGGRPLHYVYFGGGTPSYLSEGQLRKLMTRLKED